MRSNKNIGLNYLKLLLTLFVVLHHTILAYLLEGLELLLMIQTMLQDSCI